MTGASLSATGLSPTVEPVPVSPAGAASIPSAAFTDAYRETVCKIGKGADCCRYLTMGGSGWGCAKRTAMRDAIDARADKMNAKGDNCGGCFDPLPAFVLLKDRFEHPAGTVVYKATGYDYGCASDDARHTGVAHTSMTLDAAGGYPFFTVPNPDFAAQGTTP